MRRSLCAAVAASLLAAGSAHARPAEVIVTNTSAAPVFVTAAAALPVTAPNALPVLVGAPVTIEVDSPLPVDQQGPVEVVGPRGSAIETQLTGTPTVRPQPEHFEVGGFFNTSATNCVVVASSINIPAGQRVILTNVDVSSQDTVQPSVYLVFYQNIPNGGTSITYPIPLESHATGRFFGSKTMLRRIWPSQTTPGTTQSASLCILPGAGDGNSSLGYSISGYYE